MYEFRAPHCAGPLVVLGHYWRSTIRLSDVGTLATTCSARIDIVEDSMHGDCQFQRCQQHAFGVRGRVSTGSIAGSLLHTRLTSQHRRLDQRIAALVGITGLN